MTVEMGSASRATRRRIWRELHERLGGEDFEALDVRLRQDTEASAVDAVVAEAAVRTRAQFLVTSDPDDKAALLDRAGAATHVVTV